MCDKLNSVLIIGSGPNVIGQSAEYDYSAVQACLALKEEGVRVIVVNSNPATVVTDKEYADAIYIEPLNIDVVKRIIDLEKPDCILPTMGGEKSFEITLELQQNGFLDEKAITLLSLNNDVVQNLEKKENFKKFLISVNEPFVDYATVGSVGDAVCFANKAGYPIIIRTAYEIGNERFEICDNLEQLSLKAKDYLEASLLHQVIIEKCVSGWKEIEYETIRDKNGNCSSVSNMENLDPVGISSGDSIIIIPAQTLTHEENMGLRAAALKIITELNIIGNCGIQFALNPQGGEYVVLSITPRFSRSSALISKASGYPIARICAKLVAGCDLFGITGCVTECKEPITEYCAVKFPTWSFEKFENVDRKLGTEMQATGETLSFGKTFEHAFLKAVRSIDTGACLSGLRKYETASGEQLFEVIRESNDERIFAVYEAVRRGLPVDTIYEITKIDPWFLSKLKNIAHMETLIASHYSGDVYKKAKIMGFSDLAIESISGHKSKTLFMPNFNRVDACAVGIDSACSYYSSFEDETVRSVDCDKKGKRKILIIGAGPTMIGHGSELEFCMVQCIATLKSAGYTVIVVNNNPEAVSTDYSLADRLYIEPLSSEDIENIIIAERPWGIITQFSGENFYRLTNSFSKADSRIIGTDRELLDILTNTDKISNMLAALKIPFSAENIFNATGIEIDVICDGRECLIPGISEHIEKSGIHSGDSISICPPISLQDKHKQLIIEYAKNITLALKIRGIINIRFVLNDNRLYVVGISCNLMHNIPFICKATGLRTVEIAVKCMLGEKLADMGYDGGVNPGKNLFAVRVPVFSFDKLSGTDTQLGSEMKSTGEVLGLAKTFEDALLKGLIASGVRIKRSGGVLVTVRNSDKQEVIPVAEKFSQLDFNLHATAGTARTLNANHVPSSSIRKIHEDSPHILDLINSNKVVYVISTSEKAENAHGDDVKIRRRAIEKQIPTFTTLETANALAECLKKKRSIEDIELIDITKIEEDFMAYYQDNYRIQAIDAFNSSCFDMQIYCPEIASVSKAGQFVHVQCEGKILRRPISICEIDKTAGTIRLVFDIRGEGTRWLSEKKKDEFLNILGPLGNGFDLKDIEKKALFIGGGMGVPPLLGAVKAFKGKADAILGFSCIDNSMLIEDFNCACSNVIMMSDDGSLGEKGFVTSLLCDRITTNKYDVVYSCGPSAMLKAVSKIVLENNIECYVSMEERMACGVGACLVCACKVKVNDREAYKHVCKDGPVFNAKEIVW